MSQLSAEIRREKDWWQRFQNQTVRESWARDASDRVWNIRTPSAYAEVPLSDKQIDYVLDELAGYAALRDGENKCQVSCFERVWESDCLLDQSHISGLNTELAALREPSNTPSDGPTTTLVDPYLHPLVYDKTLVSLPHRSPRPQHPPALTDIYTLSQRFALLPSDIFVSALYTVELLSYINNLPPHHTPLYKLLETTLGAFMPLFEHTLTDLHRNNPLLQRIPGSCRYTVWDEPDPPEYSDDEDGWAVYEREMRHWIMNRPIKLPDVPPGGYQGGLEHRKYAVSLRDKRLQVIVNVSETRIEPGGQPYAGSPWHVEGMKNERIVACGFHYLSVENIVNSSVEFRMAVTAPRGFDAGDSGATLRTWGLRDGDSCHQYIGSVPINSGLALVFPNIYQHRNTSFELADPEQPGHQRVLSFFLVDPDIQPIISTADVAPQQKEWIRRALHEHLDVRLPVEIVEAIVEDVEGVMEAEEAESLRSQIEDERARFWAANDTYHFCIPFDVWTANML